MKTNSTNGFLGSRRFWLSQSQ